MRFDAQNGRRLIVLAAALGVVLRLGFGLTYWVDKPLTHDEREYLALAWSLAHGRGFVYDESHDSGTAQRFGRAPGYPMFLAAIGAGTTEAHSSPRRVKIAQSFLGGLVVWLIGLIAFHAAGPATGVAAAALAAVYPPLIWMPAYVFSETLYSWAALAAAVVLQLAVDRAGARGVREGGPLALLAGALIGAAILIRPAMLLFLPLASLWLAWRRQYVLVVAMLATTAAVVAPWTLRNLRVHDRFVLVASEGGVTFWTGNHPMARGEGDLAANPDLKRAELQFRRAHPGLTAEQLEPLYYRDAFRFIRENPMWWVGLLARKAFFTVVPIGPSYALHSSRYRIASAASYVLVLPFAVTGAKRLWRSPRRPVALLLLGASAVLMSLVFFPQERFRIPIIDPVLIICAGAAMDRARRS
jgi:hypothetical protein